MESILTQAGSTLFLCLTLMMPLNFEDQTNLKALQKFFPWIERNKDSLPQVYVYKYAHSAADPERVLAYFREDMMLNSHHYHFHNAFPFEWSPKDGNYIDRKGELFYYMHQQILARFDAERISCRYNRIVPLHNLRKPIEEAYFPKFPPLSVGSNFPGRPPYMTLSTLGKKFGGASVARLEQARNRVLEAIDAGYVTDAAGNKVSLANNQGIDLLGAMLQSTTTSIDRTKYGNLHNNGHDMIARICDPEGIFGLDPGVMELATTTLRDPLFFRWHKEIDDIMDVHKMLMPPYTIDELFFPKIDLKSISVKGVITNTVNRLTTYTQELKTFLKSGFDFTSPLPIAVLFKVLQHEEFNYEIILDVKDSERVRGVVRIFLAPLFDYKDRPIPLHHQRRLFMEMDKFQVDLAPGLQTVVRSSVHSHVTLPDEKVKNILARGPVTGDLHEGHEGCGWPHHLLLPKGRVEGMPFSLFVMVTDWDEDKVETNPEQVFEDASSYCGIFDQKYPDKRNLGYPFDRQIQINVSMERFLTPNMAATEISIVHSLQIIPEGVTFNPRFDPPNDAIGSIMHLLTGMEVLQRDLNQLTI